MTLPNISMLHVAGFLFGPPLWTFLEYVLHRFAFHEARGKNYGSREHLRHHAKKDAVLGLRSEGKVNSMWLAWAGVWAVGLFVIPMVGARLGHGQFARGEGLGFIAGYFFYEWIHWRAHMRPIANAYEREVRKHHFIHHFHAPMKNHGVTITFWDKVFGTYVDVDKVQVPRRMAMDWLFDERGEILPEHAVDYAIRGSRTLDDELQADDHDRAFANEAPALV